MTQQREAVFENVGTIFERVIERLGKRKEAPEHPFGLTELDEITHGITKERVTIIAARPSEGKTSLALQTAYRIANANRPVAYLSLEDDREQLVEKLFCNIFEVDNIVLKKGMNSFLTPKIESASKIFENLKLLALDGFGYNFSEFKHVVKSLQPKPEVILLDYIQMIDSGKNETRWDSISEFVRLVKRFALDEQIAVVILSQVNRTGADASRPGLHHLKQAGTLEEVADLVLILHYPFRYGAPSFDYMNRVGRGMQYAPQDYLEIQVEKNKTGKTGIVPVRFIGPHYRFEDWRPNE